MRRGQSGRLGLLSVALVGVALGCGEAPAPEGPFVALPTGLEAGAALGWFDPSGHAALFSPPTFVPLCDRQLSGDSHAWTSTGAEGTGVEVRFNHSGTPSRGTILRTRSNARVETTVRWSAVEAPEGGLEGQVWDNLTTSSRTGDAAGFQLVFVRIGSGELVGIAQIAEGRIGMPHALQARATTPDRVRFGVSDSLTFGLSLDDASKAVITAPDPLFSDTLVGLGSVFDSLEALALGCRGSPDRAF